MPKHEFIDPKDRTFVSKRWGYEDWIFNDEDLNLCQKVLFIKAGKRTGIHRHPVKDEVITCESGALFVELANQDPPNGAEVCATLRLVRIRPGRSIRLWPGTWHRLAAEEDTRLYEASTFHDDEDVERMESWKAVYDDAADQNLEQPCVGEVAVTDAEEEVHCGCEGCDYSP